MENLAVRHQLIVLKRSQRGRLRLDSADRLLWVWLSRFWSNWRSALLIVKPGRPTIDLEIRELIRKMSLANPLWGAPRIHGELLKVGIKVSQATVAKYMARPQKPPSQTWRAFLNNHVNRLVSTDFFVLSTVTFRVLYVFIVLAHQRRRLLHFNVTANATSEWTAQQLIEAFPWGKGPRYLLRDRDSIYEGFVRQRLRGMRFRKS